MLERVESDLGSLNGKAILVLCSARGDLAFRLAQKVGAGRVLGLELDDTSLRASRALAEAQSVTNRLRFESAARTRIPVPDGTFDVVVSEFIVFPTPAPTEIGQPEMARVLRPGGRIGLTDVLVTRPVPPDVRGELKTIGLDYLCEGTPGDFVRWMGEAGLVDVNVADLTPLVSSVWEARRNADPDRSRGGGYAALLDPDSEYRLGRAIFYIGAHGTKPGRGRT